MVKGDTVYWVRVIPSLDIYEVNELSVITSKETYFTGMDKRTKRTQIFSNTDIDKIVFSNRDDALVLVKEHEQCHEKTCVHKGCIVKGEEWT